MQIPQLHVSEVWTLQRKPLRVGCPPWLQGASVGILGRGGVQAIFPGPIPTSDTGSDKAAHWHALIPPQEGVTLHFCSAFFAPHYFNKSHFPVLIEPSNAADTPNRCTATSCSLVPPGIDRCFGLHTFGFESFLLLQEPCLTQTPRIQGKLREQRSHTWHKQGRWPPSPKQVPLSFLTFLTHSRNHW